MSTTRDHRNGFNRRRATNLVRARQERMLSQRRKNGPVEQEVFSSLEHDRRVEEELMYGPKWEQENDPAYKF